MDEIFRGSTPSLFRIAADRLPFPWASHDSLPPHILNELVPCRWLAVTRAGLSSLLILALLGALILFTFYFLACASLNNIVISSPMFTR